MKVLKNLLLVFMTILVLNPIESPVKAQSFTSCDRQNYRDEAIDFRTRETINNFFAVKSEEEQIRYVAGRLRQYLARIVQASKYYGPPAPNAGSGWFSQNMKDLAREGFDRPAEITLTGKAKDLFDLYMSFYSQNQNSWSPGNHEKPWIHHARDLTFKVVKALSISFAGKTIFPAAFRLDAAYLWDELFKNPDIIKGTHANGWIASNVQNTANVTLQQINARFTTSDNSAAGKLAQTFRGMLNTLRTLRIDDHDPWLRGTWQLEYQIIMEGTILTIDQL